MLAGAASVPVSILHFAQTKRDYFVSKDGKAVKRVVNTY